MRLRFAAVSFFTLLIAPVVASALPITSVFVGSGSGTIGAVAFTDANFVITTSADTANVQAFPVFCCGWFIEDDLASIAIGGVGSADFTIGTRVFVNNRSQAVGFSGAVFGDLLDLNCDIDCTIWDMTTSFGPVFDATPFAIDQFANVGTTLGLLTMESAIFVSFEATVVPEPSAALAFGIGALLIAGVRGRRR